MADKQAGTSQTFSEKDFMAQKAKAEKYEKLYKEQETTVSRLTSELKIAKTNVEDDDEVKLVKQHLLDQEAEIRKNREQYEKDRAGFDEKIKASNVKAWASQYGVDVVDIKDAEDPEKEALRLQAARMTEEAKTASPGSVVERGTGGMSETGVWDKTQKQFDESWDAQKRQATLVKK